MLTVAVQELGDASVLICRGRIVVGDPCSILRHAVLGQHHANMLVLDLARVDRIDAGGLGILMGLQRWARSGGIVFKLMNVTQEVEKVFELTGLQRAFGFCSVRDLFCLLHRAAFVSSGAADPRTDPAFIASHLRKEPPPPAVPPANPPSALPAYQPRAWLPPK